MDEEKRISEVTCTLFHALAKGQGIQEITEIGSKFVGNPMFVRDKFFKILAYTKNVEVDDYIWNEEVVRKGYQPFESFQYLTKNGFFEKVEKEREPVCFKNKCCEDNVDMGSDIEYALIEDDLLEKRVKMARIWSNIWKNDKIIGQIVVLEAFKTFKKSDLEIVKLIGDTISQVIQKKGEYEEIIDSHRDKLIIDILNEQVRDKNIINERLRFSDWRQNSYLQVLVIANEKKSMSSMPFNYLSGFFTDVFQNSFCLKYKGDIIVILERHLGKELHKSHLSSLEQFMEDTGLYCGFSRIFSELNDLKKYYNQAVIALKNGRRSHENSFVYYYDESTLQHVLSICSDAEPLKELCHPSVLKLVEYDKLNHTNYVGTLYSYVMNFGKASEIADQKHLHRNTLYYRIGKIEDIIKLDLKNIDHFFTIYFTFKVLEYSEDEIFLSLF